LRGLTLKRPVDFTGQRDDAAVNVRFDAGAGQIGGPAQGGDVKLA